jgi:hypothetical protein
MHALPPITNPLRPRVSRSWIPPIRFRSKPYQQLSESFSAALAELEARYPSHQPAFLEERKVRQLGRKPR